MYSFDVANESKNNFVLRLKSLGLVLSPRNKNLRKSAKIISRNVVIRQGVRNQNSEFLASEYHIIIITHFKIASTYYLIPLQKCCHLTAPMKSSCSTFLTLGSDTLILRAFVAPSENCKYYNTDSFVFGVLLVHFLIIILFYSSVLSRGCYLIP